ncbi:MAG: PP2C family protein-serine/threonine phosphatase, partial [Aeromicrobium sp.]
MTTLLRRAARPVGDYFSTRLVRWRTGSTEGQIGVMVGLFLLVDVITVISLADYNRMPITTFIIPMLLGSLALRYRPLMLLLGFTVVCVTATLVKEGLAPVRVSGLIALGLAAIIILFESRTHRSGLPGPLGEAMLVDLRDRLQSQGVVPPLPTGWVAQSAMLSAGGAKFAGDFMVADLSEDEKHLEMVLVDVCGKGVAAGTQSLQFAGALGGLIGALPPQALFAAANSFLLRQRWDDGFATAVHVLINLQTGDFTIISAGHPPALRWESDRRQWEIDGARGMALGI